MMSSWVSQTTAKNLSIRKSLKKVWANSNNVVWITWKTRHSPIDCLHCSIRTRAVPSMWKNSSADCLYYARALSRKRSHVSIFTFLTISNIHFCLHFSSETVRPLWREFSQMPSFCLCLRQSLEKKFCAESDVQGQSWHSPTLQSQLQFFFISLCSF